MRASESRKIPLSITSPLVQSPCYSGLLNLRRAANGGRDEDTQKLAQVTVIFVSVAIHHVKVP